MPSTLERIFRVRKNETRLVLVFAALFFLNSVAQEISAITSVSNFLSEGGVNSILVVWAVDAVVIFLFTSLQSFIIDRFERMRLTRWVLGLMAGAFLLLRLLFIIGMPAWFNYGLLYIISEQQWLFMALVFWTLAGDLMDVSQATRLMPVIAAGDFGGKLAGIGISAAAPALLAQLPALGFEDLLILNVLLYVLAFFIFWLGLRDIRPHALAKVHETVGNTLKEGWDFIRHVPAFRYLTLATFLMLICDTIVEFRFLAVSEAAFPGTAQYQTFYSVYRLSVVLISLLLLGLVTNKIINSLQLKTAFLIEPVANFISPIWMIVNAGLVGGLGAIFFLKIPQIAIGDAARKAFQGLVPEERRGRVAIFMDSYQFGLGTLIGCGVTGLILLAGQGLGSQNAFYAYLLAALLASFASILAAWKMHAEYDTSLLNWRLKRRQRMKSVLDLLDLGDL